MKQNSIHLESSGRLNGIVILTKMNEDECKTNFHLPKFGELHRGAGYPSMPLLPGGVIISAV